MSFKRQHLSSAAKSGPPTERKPAPVPPKPPKWRIWLLVAGLVVTFFLLVHPSMRSTTTESLNYTQFTGQVTANAVHTATIDQNGMVSGQLANGHLYTSEIPLALDSTSLTASLQKHHVQIQAATASGFTLMTLVVDLAPIVLFLGLFMWMGKRAQKQLGGGIMGIGGSKAKRYDIDRPTTRFGDVAGYEGAKNEVSEVVDFLKHPERYAKAGAVGPRGVLMVGPPGTGKTLMARAVAGEAEVPFFALTGSSFVEMFVGVGASRVRDLFEKARKSAPAIIFIDEIDAIGHRRGGSMVNNDEREQTLNQLLAEMDGFDTDTGVVVIAATNRPETLDPALLRPGRFDRHVEIPLPNLSERKAILAVHSAGKKLDSGVNLDAIGRGTPGFSGADLANLVNEAAIHAVRDNREVLSAADFDQARDRILIGRRDASNALLPDEAHAVAVHESGHALVAMLSAHADPVAKVTILPAGQALGVTEQLPETERHLYPESYLKDSLAVRLGGRAAELLFLGEASTGAANDLAGATDLATKMVREWGLSDAVGPVGFASDGPNYLGEGGFQSRPYAEDTQRTIDQEVRRLLREAEQTALDLIGGHRQHMEQFVALLMDKETVDGAELALIVGGNGSRALEPDRVPVGVQASALDARTVQP